MAKKKNIVPATRKNYATIHLTQQDKVRISELVSEVFLKRKEYPKGIKFYVKDGSWVKESAKNRIIDHTIEIK